MNASVTQLEHFRGFGWCQCATRGQQSNDIYDFYDVCGICGYDVFYGGDHRDNDRDRDDFHYVYDNDEPCRCECDNDYAYVYGLNGDYHVPLQEHQSIQAIEMQEIISLVFDF